MKSTEVVTMDMQSAPVRRGSIVRSLPSNGNNSITRASLKKVVAVKEHNATVRSLRLHEWWWWFLMYSFRVSRWRALVSFGCGAVIVGPAVALTATPTGRFIIYVCVSGLCGLVGLVMMIRDGRKCAGLGQ